VVQGQTKTQLNKLQASQNANASYADANLRLEKVDFSTPDKVVTNLPQRMRDVLLRPYPWQLATSNQRFGVMGSLAALAVLFYLLRAAWRVRLGVVRAAGPIIYPLLFLLVGYSMSAGNAGTSFRYRIHLIVLAIGAVFVLLETAPSRGAATRLPQPRVPGRVRLAPETP
jgi:hypothetical protein